jgi:predicted secreted protein
VTLAGTGRLTMRTFALILGLWCLQSASAVLAQNTLSLGELPPGSLVLNLSASEQRDIEQDTLTAVLEYAEQGRDQVVLQDKINQVMQRSLALARAIEGVQVQSGSYQVYLVQNTPGIFSADNPVWRAQQSMQISGMDSAVLLELAGKLQSNGLSMNNLYYSLSPTRHEQVAGELTTTLLQTLQQRAALAGLALGKSHAELIEVSLDGQGDVPFARQAYAMAGMAMDALISTPAAEPGQTPVTVSVSARAILSP